MDMSQVPVFLRDVAAILGPQSIADPKRGRCQWFEHADTYPCGISVDDPGAVMSKYGPRPARVRIPGSACGLITTAKLLPLITRIGVVCSRIDIATDFHGGVAEGLIGELIDDADRGLGAGFRTWEARQPRCGAEFTGDSVNIGKRGKDGSGRYVRVYDKGLEQQALPMGQHIRYEVEYANEAAHEVYLALIGASGPKRSLAEFALGGISMCHRAKQDRRKGATPTKTWQWLEDAIGEAQLVVRIETKRAKDKLRWFMHGGPARLMQQVLAAAGGDLERAWDLLVTQAGRKKPCPAVALELGIMLGHHPPIAVR